MAPYLSGFFKSSVAAFSFLALISFAHAQESTSFQINPAHTGGLSTTTAFAPPLKRLWTLDLNGPITYPIVVKNMVIVNYLDRSYNDILYAVSATTGRLLWKKTYSNARYLSYAAYDNGVVFEFGATGVLEAFEASNGKFLWSEQFSASDNDSYPPVASGGFVYITLTSGGVYQISEQTGQALWVADTSAQSSASIVSGKIFVAGACSVEALSASFGAVIWNAASGEDCDDGDPALAPIPINNLVFSPQYNQNGGALLNSKTGTFVRSISQGTTAILNGLAFQENYSGFQATQLSNGKTIWTNSITAASFIMPPIVVNDVLYALSFQGTLYAINSKTGVVLQKIAAGQSAGAFSNNNMSGLGAGRGILVVPSDNQLIAFAPESKNTAVH
jgi:outer membrane protein assembly factor BamB